MPVLAGIDYSLTSPAICVYDTEKGDFSYQCTEMYFRSNLTRFEAFSEGNLHGSNHGPWDSEIDRYDDISSWALRVLTKHQVTQVYLEGYSFGSTGRVFNIAENTGILKYKLWDALIHCDILAPTTVKKFATGSGRASKVDMYNQFVEENGESNLKDSLTTSSDNIISPLNDVVDAYYILKCGIFN